MTSVAKWISIGAGVLTRGGRVATITEVNPDCHISTKPVKGVFADGQPCNWMHDGRFWFNGQTDDFDIVGPAPIEAPSPAAKGK
ncbi:Hypothetical protein NGAL_HAMBI1146_59850 [Neorhizobium galegae bv. officinalis]|nr:Hypothetical protein NGAL_HAMBI1146_59850 [Neorhizobium galegae bv. officinalis]